mmetsp:Transcript_54537/g.97392  ORF Transcript_54537/g.97392 Transcript_54537/m.97392 type:complete len:319 (-) Transcript_54537:99-1055(-)
MGKASNETQATLRLLCYALLAVIGLLVVVRLFSNYVIGKHGGLSVVLVPVTVLYWIWKRYHQTKSRSEQEALLAQHQSFAAEVERAWERSHTHDAERRRAPPRTQQRGDWDSTAELAKAKSSQLEAEAASTKKKKKKKKDDEEEEEVFYVDDAVEAKVVEDLEDFLGHSRLRQALKNTANDMRESRQRRQEKKAPKPVPPVPAPAVKEKEAKQQVQADSKLTEKETRKPEKAAKSKAKAAENGKPKAERVKAVPPPPTPVEPLPHKAAAQAAAQAAALAAGKGKSETHSSGKGYRKGNGKGEASKGKGKSGAAKVPSG